MRVACIFRARTHHAFVCMRVRMNNLTVANGGFVVFLYHISNPIEHITATVAVATNEANNMLKMCAKSV